MERLLNLVKQWARIAYNWLKNFVKVVWGLIKSYWPKLKEFLKDWIQQFKEVIILDARESGGRSIIEKLQEERPTELASENLDGLVSLGISDAGIVKVSDLEATTQETDQYDSMSHENNGILRING